MDPSIVLNKRFNRHERNGVHVYITEFDKHDWGTRHEGLIKCKLVHGVGYSLIVPDMLFVGPGHQLWIQPFQFLANHLGKTDSDILCALWVDISCGYNVRVEFCASGLVRKFDDGSELYRCSINGPPDLLEYAAGDCEWRATSPFLRLFHHSTADAIAGIRRDGAFRLSSWNIQGTKELENSGYAYFTPLNALTCDTDLHHIAMASTGAIHLQTDWYNGNGFIVAGKEPDGVLRLPVYRQSTDDRRHSLAVSVEASALASQHLLRHARNGKPVYYEVVNPFIHRVGAGKGQVVQLENDTINVGRPGLHHYNYVIVGDATTVVGLCAPYDEERTDHIAKIEKPATNMLEFWFENANTELYTRLSPEKMQFRPSAPAATANVMPRVGRNDPCPCGSGLKSKKCHGK